ncbi:unnamed protein product [Polarella glacialis]|nr:unnamed protein product [Polarella glacialis]
MMPGSWDFCECVAVPALYKPDPKRMSNPGHGISSRLEEQIPIAIAELNLFGPFDSNVASCAVGQPRCRISKLLGYGLQIGDYLRIMPSCSMPGMLDATPAGFIEGAWAQMNENGSFDMNSTVSMSQVEAGIYKLCYCREAIGHDCQSIRSFNIEAGTFLFDGPSYEPTIKLTIGDTFNLSIAGTGLSSEDEVRLALKCGSSQGRYLQAHAVASRVYYFGTLTSDQLDAGEYQLCWCTVKRDSHFCNTSEDFQAFFGIVGLQCFAGHVNLGDGQCLRCHRVWEGPNDARNMCVTDPIMLLILFLFNALMVLALWILFSHLDAFKDQNKNKTTQTTATK